MKTLMAFTLFVAVQATALAQQGAQQTPTIPPVIYDCVIAIITKSGTICVKPDGNVDLPDGIGISEASKEFWIELAKDYRWLKEQK